MVTPNNTAAPVASANNSTLGTIPTGFCVNTWKAQNAAPMPLQKAFSALRDFAVDEQMQNFVVNGAAADTLSAIYQLRAQVNELEIAFHESARAHVASLRDEIKSLESLGLQETPAR